MTNVPVMHYDAGGDGELLVLLPGGLTGWLSWIPHAEALSEVRKVIRVQLHSVALGLDNEPLPPDYSVDYEIASFGKTMDNLNINRADIAAWSYGAETALSYAIHNPDRVRTLTLIEPPVFWVLRSRGPLSDEMLREQKINQSFAVDDVSEDQLVYFAHFAGFVPEDVDPRTLPLWSSWFKHRQSLRMADAPFRHEDNIELVRAFDRPVLLVKGEGSSTYYYDIIDILAEEFPNAHVVSFPGGHAPHIISMQPFMDEFRRFLEQQNLPRERYCSIPKS
ncbi:MAG: alpha/beta hydrolase [Chloroflexi bacterium]|nr:alpha/beta hydrolase [Chloroflexota bacterium]